MRPVDEQLGLTMQKYSPLLQEFSMMFCTEEAFLPGAEAFETIFRQKLSVDTLERVSRMMGDEAADFLESLPTPAREEEGELLVKTADGKGVPMVRRDAQRLRACDPRPDRPGNRRMATVACVYSVDRLIRSADEVIAALFSSHNAGQAASPSRPQPRHKRYTASFGRWLPDLDEPVSGTCVAMAWANIEVECRHQPGQTLITLIDGQHSLWDAAAEQMGVPEEDNVEILDLLHVCSYVWKSAKIIHGKRNDQERFVKAKLNQILNGRVSGVLRSLRYLATAHRLPESKRDELERICGYFESHADRMKYDVYLAKGYPIATGVIEGACRHIVKDRLERSGMRWSQPGAQGILNLRCLRASGRWTDFHAQRCSPASSQNPLNA